MSMFRKKFGLLLSTFALFFILIGSAELSSFSVLANTNEEVFLPYSLKESLDLNSSAPINATVYDDGAAVITENKSLYIFKDNKYAKYLRLTHSNPSQIRHFGDNFLLVNDNLCLFTINLNSISDKPSPLTYKGTQIYSSYFDINKNYLATVSNNQVTLFRLNGTTVIEGTTLPVTAKLLTPVCVNSNGQVFFIRSSDSKLCIYDGSENNGTPVLTPSSDGVGNLLAKDGLIYFTMNNSVWCIDEKTVETDAVAPTKIECSTLFSKYDLGNLKKPTDMHFYEDNLVITDSQTGAVSEFLIDDGKLVFTGRAIARDKTAFNRITDKTSVISQNNGIIGLIDDFKVTIVNTNDQFNAYDVNSYKNYFLEDIGTPISIAVGNKTAILAFENKINIINFNDGKLSEDIEFLNLKQVKFFNNKFYLLSFDGTTSSVYTTTEDEFNPVKLSTTNIDAKDISVDVFSNVYLYNGAGIYKNNTLLANRVGVIDMFTDLSGNLFTVEGSTINYFDTSLRSFKLFYSASGVISSITNNLANNELLYTINGEEFIYKITPDNYSAISNLKIPSDFKLNGTSAGTINSVTVKDNSIVYSVDYKNGFSYIKQAEKESEYLLICTTSFNGVNGKTDFAVLGGAGDVMITHKSLTESKTVNYDTNVLNRSFIATDVNAYYLPVITKNNIFAINNGNVVRLKKGTEIKPTNSFTFANIPFYTAEISLNGETIKAYVPTTFTAGTLSSNPGYIEHSIETVNVTVLYKDSALTQKICDITKNSKVRVYSIENGVAQIEFLTSDGYIAGYINSESIINWSAIQTRNALLIILASACICGTLTFFIMRKKSLNEK